MAPGPLFTLTNQQRSFYPIHLGHLNIHQNDIKGALLKSGQLLRDRFWTAVTECPCRSRIRMTSFLLTGWSSARRIEHSFERMAADPGTAAAVAADDDSSLDCDDVV